MLLSSQIGIGVVGCGQIAEAHLKGIHTVPGAQLVGCVDVVLDQAQSAAQRYNAPYYGTDYDQLLSLEAVDAVVLCLPHDLHLPFSVRASQAGKHVLVEKPMALNEVEAQQMVDAAHRAGRQLSVGQSTRFMPTVQEAKRVLASGRIGRVRHVIHQRLFMIEQVSTQWRKSQEACGGLYLPLFGSHDVDAILWLLNDRPSRVWATVRSFSKATDGDSDGFIGLEFADGKIGSMAFSVRSKRVRTETVFVGDVATLALGRDKLFLDDQALEVSGNENAFVLQMRQFVDALLLGEMTPTQGTEVLVVMRTLDLARQASRTGTQMVF